MQRLIILTILNIFVLSHLISQDDGLENKIEKMLDLTGSKRNFEMVIDQSIEIQKDAFSGELEGDFYEKFSEKIKASGYDKIVKKLVPVYAKHLTEEDLDGIIEFYESEVGKRLIEKTPYIMTESMEIGAEWGKELATEILEELDGYESSKQEELEAKFNLEISEDCSGFKEGNFVSYLMDSSVVKIERKADTQFEVTNGHVNEYRIQWVSNNRYHLIELIALENGEMTEEILEVNIYEVDGKSYKYVSRTKGIDFYDDGEIIKLE